MKNNLREEIYKFRHQGTPYYGIVALILLMIYTAISGKINSNIISMGFGAGQWIIIILITVASNFIDMEYRNNTITTLFYKHSRKSQIYIAKFLIIALYGLGLIMLGILSTLVMKQLLVGAKYSWETVYMAKKILLNSLLLNMLGAFIYALFISALAFFLINLLKINAAVIGIGLAIGFLGLDISNAVITAFPNLMGIIKWNPLNMISVIAQLSDTSYTKFSYLSNNQLVWGNLIYIVIFLVGGNLLFNKRRV